MAKIYFLPFLAIMGQLSCSKNKRKKLRHESPGWLQVFDNCCPGKDLANLKLEIPELNHHDTSCNAKLA